MIILPMALLATGGAFAPVLRGAAPAARLRPSVRVLPGRPDAANGEGFARWFERRRFATRRSRFAAFGGFATPAIAATAVGGLRLALGAKSIPHPEKRAKGGEDAYFACEDLSAFGVADGVGGSATETVDPGVFSRTLLRHCQRGMREAPEGEGDSGAILLRPAPKWTVNGEGPVLWPRVVLRSSEQTLYFNCPYQVEATEAPMLLRSVDLLRAQVHEGDIVLAATDGVFDNLFDR